MWHLLSDQHILQLQKGSNPWALKHSEMEKHGSNWKEVGKREWSTLRMLLLLRSVLRVRWEDVCTPINTPLNSK